MGGGSECQCWRNWMGALKTQRCVPRPRRRPIPRTLAAGSAVGMTASNRGRRKGGRTTQSSLGLRLRGARRVRLIRPAGWICKTGSCSAMRFSTTMGSTMGGSTIGSSTAMGISAGGSSSLRRRLRRIPRGGRIGGSSSLTAMGSSTTASSSMAAGSGACRPRAAQRCGAALPRPRPPAAGRGSATAGSTGTAAPPLKKVSSSNASLVFKNPH